jgi:hypothetical protein
MRMAYAFWHGCPHRARRRRRIAGPTLAFWLNCNGYRVIVVETAPGIRAGGQTVDLRGAGREVVARMGLLEQMTALALDQAGAAWVRADGSRRAEMPVTAFDGNGLVSTVEILRGDIADVLYSTTSADTDYRFGVRIEALEQKPDGVHATLSDGTTTSADLSSAPTVRTRPYGDWRGDPRISSSLPSAGTTPGSRHRTPSASTAGS